MLTFLQILLAVFISIIVLILLVFFWLKRKFGRFVKNAMSLYELMPPVPSRERLTRASRLDLDDYEPEDLAESLAAKKAELGQLGYQERAVYTRQDDSPVLLFMHPEQPVFVVLSLREQRWCLETLTLNTVPKAFWQREQATPAAQQLPHLELTTAPTLDIATAIGQAERDHHELRPLRAEQFVALYERVSAMETDRFLSERPTLAWLRSQVPADKAKTLTEDKWQELLNTILAQWKNSLGEALIDEAQRRLGWDVQTAERLRGALVVVHRYTSADDLQAAFSSTDLADRLIAQLRQQNLTDRQIFDEVNQRLEAPDKLHKLTQVSNPVPADVYLPARFAEQIRQPDAALIP